MMTQNETIVHQLAEAAVIQALGGQCRRVNSEEFVFIGNQAAGLEAYRQNLPVPARYLTAAYKQLQWRRAQARKHRDNEVACASSRGALYGDVLTPEAS
jgi:hypothetical protein